MTTAQTASINGVSLNTATEVVTPEILRQRACSELLRQAAIARNLLASDDEPAVEGVLSEAATTAIEQLLEQALDIPDPSEDECRRHYAARPARYATAEQVRLRHILFAVTPGVDVVALRNRAETTLLDVRCHDGKAPEDRFAAAARTQSNCPSGAEGGSLGWLSSGDCAPEFAREIFGKNEVGVLPRLVHSRFGLHVVEVLERQAGTVQSFDSVRGAVVMAMRQQTFVAALRQYLQQLAGQAEIVGVDLESAETPLVQ